MKTRYKILISFLLGICLIAIGYSMGGSDDLLQMSWLNWLDFRWEAQVIQDQELTLHDIRELELDLSSMDVRIHEEDTLSHNTIKVVASYLYQGFQMEQDHDTLKIEQSNHHILKKYRNGVSQIDVYVPKGYVFDEVDIDAHATRNTLSNLHTKKFNLDSAMSQIDIYHLECENDLIIDNALSQIDVHVIGQQANFGYKINTFLGKIDVGNESYAGLAHHKLSLNKRHIMNIDCFAGDIDITMEEKYDE